jgi:hypothetical protein
MLAPAPARAAHGVEFGRKVDSDAPDAQGALPGSLPRSTFQPRSAPMTRGWLPSFRLYVSRRIGPARKWTNRLRLEDRPPTRPFSEWRLEGKPVILAAE